MAYLLSNICTKNYCKRTTSVKIIVGSWVVYFFETQCSHVRVKNSIITFTGTHFCLCAMNSTRIALTHR